ncbi:MAG: response regulator, partial [Oleiphilaceae bacterium]|nr:response regulator [Oleiphilaceae bacterium]
MALIKVLVVDDSPSICRILTEILSADPNLKVVGHARDPYEARELIKQLQPDVLTLDVEMPRMDGITFLRNLMRLRPMPVVMISSVTEHGAPATLEALALGAVDYLAKPDAESWHNLEDYAELIREKVRIAGGANVGAFDHLRMTSPIAIDKTAPYRANTIIALGASTGGTEALRLILSGMPEHSPPILMVQHIPASFSATFARRLDRDCEIKVIEAIDSLPLEPGHAYVAPGGRHLRVIERDGECLIQLDE